MCTRQSVRRGTQPKTLSTIAPDCPVCTGQSGQRSDPTIDRYIPQWSTDVARVSDMSGAPDDKGNQFSVQQL
jgi:hypothetical protein